MLTKWGVVVEDTSETMRFLVGPFDSEEEAGDFSYMINNSLRLLGEFGSSIVPFLQEHGWVGSKRRRSRLKESDEDDLLPCERD